MALTQSRIGTRLQNTAFLPFDRLSPGLLPTVHFAWFPSFASLAPFPCIVNLGSVVDPNILLQHLKFHLPPLLSCQRQHKCQMYPLVCFLRPVPLTSKHWRAMSRLIGCHRAAVPPPHYRACPLCLLTESKLPLSTIII